ncbi:MAG: hypothetical protein IJP82_00950 [Bacteroidaceae bacterium]|nr:hypothetical protein [Bacteroidaceae bacterium]
METKFTSTPATLLGLDPRKWFAYISDIGQHTFASSVDRKDVFLMEVRYSVNAALGFWCLIVCEWGKVFTKTRYHEAYQFMHGC